MERDLPHDAGHPELVPAEGLDRTTRAFLSVIDEMNEMTLTELLAHTMF